MGNQRDKLFHHGDKNDYHSICVADLKRPTELADWLLGLIEKGTFRDPSETVFVILGQHQELEPHADLRCEILARSL